MVNSRYAFLCIVQPKPGAINPAFAIVSKKQNVSISLASTFSSHALHFNPFPQNPFFHFRFLGHFLVTIFTLNLICCKRYYHLFSLTSTMPPRKRPKRKFEGERMEEVLRHFRIENLGFDEKVVKTVAKQILKEYDVGEGTDGAWCFITQNNYQLLIEQILEYQEINQPEGSCGAGNEDEFFEPEPPNDERALAVSGGPSGLTEMIASQEKTPDAEGFSSIGENLLTSGTAQENEAISSSPVVLKCLPCYGWINEDEEHDPDDIIILKPAGQIASEKNPRKRRSQWDLRPEDP